MSADGRRVDLTARVVEPHVLELDPFPFSGREFALEVPSRVVEARRYDSAEEAAEAYHSALAQPLRCSVRASE
jgi:hypothetical protein